MPPVDGCSSRFSRCVLVVAQGQEEFRRGGEMSNDGGAMVSGKNADENYFVLRLVDVVRIESRGKARGEAGEMAAD